MVWLPVVVLWFVVWLPVESVLAEWAVVLVVKFAKAVMKHPALFLPVSTLTGSFHPQNLPRHR